MLYLLVITGRVIGPVVMYCELVLEGSQLLPERVLCVNVVAVFGFCPSSAEWARINKDEANYDLLLARLEPGVVRKAINRPGSIDSSCLKNLIMNFMCCRCSFMPADLEGRGLFLD